MYIEQAPAEVGEPLSRELATFRKLVFGDRTWRIIWRPEKDGSATVWVIGDRDDEACYEQAMARIDSLGDNPRRETLSTVIGRLNQRRAARRQLGPLDEIRGKGGAAKP
jgi:mRNA interferase RelE/StbE